jgi:protein-tyrosine phosphatase
MDYAELHFHLLPGVDDGPSTTEESIELARAAAADGTRTIVATPHVHRLHVTDPLEIAERVDELSGHLRARGVGVEIRPGGELADDMVANLNQRQLDSIAHGPPGRRWILLEAPFRGMDAGYRAAADELRARGFGILVAHPERAMRGGASARAVLDHELAMRSAVQLTAWSLLGRYGEETRRHALEIRDATPFAVIASDAHGLDRPPALTPALAAIDDQSAGQLPRRLLEHGLSAARTRQRSPGRRATGSGWRDGSSRGAASAAPTARRS